MQYHVVPFTANIVRGQGGDAAAAHMSEAINHFAQQGWEYVRLESVRTVITNPGNGGCLGLGAVAATQDEVIVYMIVFRK